MRKTHIIHTGDTSHVAVTELSITGKARITVCNATGGEARTVLDIDGIDRLRDALYDVWRVLLEQEKGATS